MTIKIDYQRIFYDWALPNGDYTPEQLRQAKLEVKRWGKVKTYTLGGQAPER